MVNPLSRRIPGVEGSRPPPQFGLGGFNDAAMALAYGGQTPQQAMQAFQQAEQRFAQAPQGGAPSPGGMGGVNPYAQYGGFNPQAYLTANPDVGTHYQNVRDRTGNLRFASPTGGGQQGVANPYDFAYYHWLNYGRGEGRPLGL